MTSEKTVRDFHNARPYIQGTPVPESQSQLDQISREETAMTVRQKLTAAILDLKKIYPLLFAAITVIPRVESEEVPSIAVSPDTLYFNSRFLLETSREQLLFYLIHSIYHILMQHHIRGEGKDPFQWNTACDLYINKCIHDAFGATPGEAVTILTDNTGSKTVLAMPEKECFDDTIDLKTATPEAIYRALHEEHEERHMTGRDTGFGDSGKAGEGDGKELDQGYSDALPDHLKDQTPSPEARQEKDASEKETQSSPEPQPEQVHAGNRDKDPAGGEKKEPSPEGSSAKTDEEESAPSPFSEHHIRMDLVEDRKNRADSADARLQKARRLRVKINTVYQKMQEISEGGGISGDAVLEAEMHKNVSRVNWRTLLQTRLVKMTTDEKSLSTPDRRFVHCGLYLEGPVQEESLLRDVKICIDTSASMNDRDIADALFQIGHLLRQYHIQAELIFWDEIIEARLPFQDRHEFSKAGKSARGRGGTDPDCLFREFAQSNRRGHSAPVPELLLIFTDGWFDLPKKDYHRAFREKTIWILCSEDSEKEENFKPGFGKTVRLEVH